MQVNCELKQTESKPLTLLRCPVVGPLCLVLCLSTTQYTRYIVVSSSVSLSSPNHVRFTSKNNSGTVGTTRQNNKQKPRHETLEWKNDWAHDQG